jgi:hypothetical protein
MTVDNRVSVQRAAELAERQTVRLMTTGHRDTTRCFVKTLPGGMCRRWATMRVERLDYRLGMTSKGLFTPAVTLSRVCVEHGEVLRTEPGLVALFEVMCPRTFIDLPAAQVYREERPGRCRWFDCVIAPHHGRFCDDHRRWHAQRLWRQIYRANAAALQTEQDGHLMDPQQRRPEEQFPLTADEATDVRTRGRLIVERQADAAENGNAKGGKR